jgi:CubicO group peptidase (beta-lactamase class C family)
VTRQNRVLSLILPIILLSAVAPIPARAQSAPAPANLAADLDAMLANAFPADRPGAAVILVKDGKVLYRKAFGLANLELKVPMQPENVFEIGSVTKQFTSTAVLMLVEQGKIGLADDIHKYLADFPDKGATITVEHLLTHTSGIPSYTGSPKWVPLWRKEMKPAEIIALTKDDPLEFAPGSRFAYNNTGYIMLGAIIEKVSGMSYAEFVKKNIFEPLGMTNSYYGSASAVIPNRASGYSPRGGTFQNAEYLSMSQPYAAGSLMSTVDDLAIWDAAVSSGKLLTKASWERAFAGYKLSSGESTGYGYGWQTDSFEGHPIIRHNGGIFGYVSEVARLPKDGVFVAMLTNSDGPKVDTGFLATAIAAAAIGRPYREPVAVSVDAKTLDAYTGVYRIDDKTERTVTRSGDKLTFQRTGRPRVDVLASSPTEFFLPNSFTRFTFETDASGRATRMVMKTSTGAPEVATRIDKPIAAEPVAVAVDPAILASYAGTYELAPGFVLTVTSDGGRLFAEATGQSKVELFATSETEFFLKVVDARIVFVRNASGVVESLVLHQNGREIPAKRK